MKKVIRLSEDNLKKMIANILNEAVNGGWEVDDNEAQEAYEFAVQHLGKDTIDSAIIRAMSDNVLADLLAYIFRMYDFREWDEYKQSKGQSLNEDERQDQMDADWNDFENMKYFKDIDPKISSERNGSIYTTDSFANDYVPNHDDPKKSVSPAASYVWNKDFSKHYPTPESFWNPRDTRAYKYTKDKEKFDKAQARINKAEDRKTANALKQADMRPLNRKGSGNRDIMENDFQTKVNETVERVIDKYIR